MSIIPIIVGIFLTGILWGIIGVWYQGQISRKTPLCPNCNFRYTHKDELKDCPKCGNKLPELWADGSICED